MKGGKNVLWIATPFNMRRPRRDTKDTGHAADSLVRSLAMVDPFGVVLLLMMLPKLTVDAASAVFDSAGRD